LSDMAGRRWVAAGALSCLVAGLAWGGVNGENAPAFKSDLTSPLVSANALLLEAQQRAPRAVPESEPKGGSRTTGGEPHPVVLAKRQAKTCSAAAVRIPRRGVRIVTALHCAEEALELFDGQSWLRPRATAKAADGIDLAVLDFGAGPAWPGLTMRPASTVPLGERLCAWHVTHGPLGLRRERICARVVARKLRAVGSPWLVMSHPYPAGTSGSPLVDVEGRAVGVVVASDGVVGLAEPIEGVLSIAPAPRERAR
jgi:hypothetical protein